MDELQLSETLQRYFSDVFLCCDEEKSGKTSVDKTVELIKSGNVPEDIITQVNNPNSAYISNRFFGIQLKIDNLERISEI